MARLSRCVPGADYQNCASRLRTIGAALLFCVMLALLAAPLFAAEDCIAFDPNRVEAKLVNGSWKVVQGDMWMLDFGAYGKTNANTAVSIIQHYKMNSQCFVGRPHPPFQYWLVNGQSPVGSFAGEDRIPFNPNTVEVKQINGRWKIVDGNSWLFDFNTNQADADTALAIIKRYGFNSVCYVGRPNAPMQYLRKDLKLVLSPGLSLGTISPVRPDTGITARLQEDCLVTHPDKVEAKLVNGTWKVVDGNEWVLDFGASGRAKAQKAVSIIKHYNMTSHCYVGRPNAPFQYWLVNGLSPVGAFYGEDSIAFDPSKLEVQKVSGSWKIVESPGHWMFDFGAHEDQARTGLQIIKMYGFTHTCYVGRPNAPMQYFRK